MFEDKGLLEYERKQDKNNLLTGNRSEEELEKDVRDKMLGLMLLKRANKNKYERF